MATPTRDAIQTFMSITGASESLAVRKLEEYGGDLNDAVTAHFLEVERSITNPTPPISSQDNFRNMNNRSRDGTRGILPLLSAVRRFRPSMLLDPNYRRNFINQIGVSNIRDMNNSGGPFYHLGDVSRVPVENNSANEHPPLSRLEHASGSEDLSGRSSQYEMGIHGNMLRDNESNLHNNDIEHEMMQIAIEASKREFEDAYLNKQYGSSNDLSADGMGQRQRQQEDDELAHAISLSLKTAEDERIFKLTMGDQYEQPRICSSSKRTETPTSSNSKLKAGSSSLQQLPVNHESSHGAHTECHYSKDAFIPDEWGGISSKELDDAIMLETQLFGSIPEGPSFNTPRSQHEQGGPERSVGTGPHAKSHSLPAPLEEQRSLRMQQDDEYAVSLLADREKEITVLEEAETLHLKEERSHRKKLEEEMEFENMIAAKQASLPQEPAMDDDNAVTLLVRMPDGSRHGHRFLKSDRLQLLFDFIDVCKTVKPGAYKVVRPYPRRAFSVGDGSLSLNELGLTSKQEALFLEFM